MAFVGDPLLNRAAYQLKTAGGDHAKRADAKRQFLESYRIDRLISAFSCSEPKLLFSRLLQVLNRQELHDFLREKFEQMIDANEFDQIHLLISGLNPDSTRHFTQEKDIEVYHMMFALLDAVQSAEHRARPLIHSSPSLSSRKSWFQNAIKWFRDFLYSRPEHGQLRVFDMERFLFNRHTVFKHDEVYRSLFPNLDLIYIRDSLAITFHDLHDECIPDIIEWANDCIQRIEDKINQCSVQSSDALYLECDRLLDEFDEQGVRQELDPDAANRIYEPVHSRQDALLKKGDTVSPEANTWYQWYHDHQ